MGEFHIPKEKTRWVGIFFFLIITLAGVIGTPLYIHFYGLTRGESILFWVYFIATGMAITVGYHRLFSHATFKTNALIRFLLLFFGAATLEQSALKWSSQHRQHHQFTDTEKDPYSINKGFFYAHIGWIIFWKHKVNYDNVQDLMQSKMMMHQHKRYGLWSVGSGIVVPLAIGFAIGRPLGAFLLAICLRLTLVLNAAFFINSFCHMFGTKSYGDESSARDHWLGAIITNGEGYHNFHHRFPNDYRNGVRWYHWDPSKWLIYLLHCLGLVRDLHRAPEDKILAARLSAGF